MSVFVPIVSSTSTSSSSSSTSPPSPAQVAFSHPDILYPIAFFTSFLATPPHPSHDEIERSRPSLSVDFPSLTSLARVNRASVPSAFKHLYTSIKINGITPQAHESRVANVVRTLRSTEGLKNQIRTLEVEGAGGGRRDEEPNLSTLFGLTTRLSTLILSSEDILGWGWDYSALPTTLTSLTLRSVDLSHLPNLLSHTPNLVRLSFSPQRFRPHTTPEWPASLKLKEVDIQMRCCTTSRTDPAQDYILTLLEAVQGTLEKLTLTTVDDGCKAHHWGGDDVHVPVLQYLCLALAPLAGTLLHLSLLDPTHISTPQDPSSWSMIQEVVATFEKLESFTYLGKNLQPTLLPSLPSTLKSVNIQSALPASLPFTIAPLVHSYLLSRSSIFDAEGHHSRSTSLVKDQLFHTSVKINEVGGDDDSEVGREQETLNLPKKAKVYIAEGEDWTAGCEDDVGRLRELMDDGGVGELEVEGEEKRKVVVAGDGDAGWGTIGRGCVSWGVRVEW